MITDTQLQEWERLTDAATPGPWRWFESGLGLRSEGVSMSSDGEVGPYAPSEEGTDVMVIDDPNVFRGTDPVADKAFIAAAREAMPALLAEVERLRTPSGDAGRVGHAAFIRHREADGAPGHTWEEMVSDAPRVSEAWRAAGHAERAVAYALAAQDLEAYAMGFPDVTYSMAIETAAGRVRALLAPPGGPNAQMDRIRAHLREVQALAKQVATADNAAPPVRWMADMLGNIASRHGSGMPPADATERMSRLSALLREAGTLASEVAADADAPAELRVAADTVRRGLVGRTADDTLDLATLLDRVRQEFGQKAKAVAVGQIREANARAQLAPEGSPERARWEGFASGAANTGAVLSTETEQKPGGTLPTEAVTVAVDWWAALVRAQRPDTAEHVVRHFRAVLDVRLQEVLTAARWNGAPGRISLRIDCGPMDLLAEVMREARLTTGRAVMDYYLPQQKTEMRLDDKAGTVTVRVGRGAAWENVWPRPDSEKTPTGPSEPLKDGDA